MKLLQVNVVYKYGSTGKIVADIHSGLRERGISSVVCYGRGEKCREENVYKICGEFYSHLNHALANIRGIMYGGCLLSTLRLEKIIEREKPDIVHLHCLNGYFVNIYRLIAWLKKHHIKTVLTLHAEFMYTANCGHAKECEQWRSGCLDCPDFKNATSSYFFNRTSSSWKKMFRAFDNFSELYPIGISNWITKRAALSPFFEDANPVLRISNGINIDRFDKALFREYIQAMAAEYEIPTDKHLILHVTPSFEDPIKGGKYFLALQESMPDGYHFAVVGTKRESPRKNLTCIPFIKDQKKLAALYHLADVLVITSLEDNYPTVCLEAEVCGTPVVGFDVGGVSDTIFPGLGECVPAKDTERLRAAVIKWADLKDKIAPEQISRCREYHSDKRMIEDYIDLYKKMLT